MLTYLTTLTKSKTKDITLLFSFILVGFVRTESFHLFYFFSVKDIAQQLQC